MAVEQLVCFGEREWTIRRVGVDGRRAVEKHYWWIGMERLDGPGHELVHVELMVDSSWCRWRDHSVPIPNHPFFPTHQAAYSLSSSSAA